jgi:hypothetical protein
MESHGSFSRLPSINYALMVFKEFGSPYLPIARSPRINSTAPWDGTRPVNILQTAMRLSSSTSPMAAIA